MTILLVCTGATIWLSLTIGGDNELPRRKQRGINLYPPGRLKWSTILSCIAKGTDLLFALPFENLIPLLLVKLDENELETLVAYIRYRGEQAGK